MTTITLTPPIATRRQGVHPLERLNLFAGRSMGEVEFDTLQANLDYRLAQLGNASRPGILRGLDILSPQEPEIPYITVGSGLGINARGMMIGLNHMIKAEWEALLQQSNLTAGSGVFYLVLERSEQPLHSGADERQPCQRLDPDPLRDMQKVVMGQLRLRKTAIEPAQISSLDGDTIANILCEKHLHNPGDDLLKNTLPLALIALTYNGESHKVRWIRAEAGRYLAVEHSGAKTLARHYHQSVRRILGALRTTPAELFGEQFEQLFRLRYLPAFGALPLALLRQPAALPAPTLRGLPAGMNLDMIPVPQSTLAGIEAREIGRGVIDLQQPGQSLRLLLAVRDEEYRPNLLDRPESDRQIEDDVYLYHQRAHIAWMAWRQQFDALYHWLSDDTLTEAQQAQLRPPAPTLPPQAARQYFQGLIEGKMEEHNVEDPDKLPLPYRQGVPAAPAPYTGWLAGSGEPPTPPTPQENGLAVQYILNGDEIESTRQRIDENRAKLDKVRDLLVRQRQLLDANTVSMATLAGGVSTDGSGLQIARWWPYMEFSTEALEQAGATATASTTTDTGRVSASDETAVTSPQIVKSYSLSTPYMKAAAFETPLYGLTNKTEGVSIATSLGRDNRDIGKTLGYNAVQFDYIQTLDLLSSVMNQARQKPSEPQFKVENATFGVMKHLDPALDEYRIANEGLTDLYDDYQALEELDDKELNNFKNRMAYGKADYLPDPADIELTDDETVKTGLKNRALFRNSRVLTRFIAHLQQKNDNLVRTIRDDEKRLKELLAKQQQLSGQISAARAKLIQLDRTRAEYHGDYTQACALAAEEWERVAALHEERSRILNSLVGLYFVKVRRTPVSRTIRQPLRLHPRNDEMLLPGCIVGDERELPDSLDLFFDAVLEIPLNSWRSLQPYLHLLPGRHRIDKLQRQRRERLTLKRQGGFYLQADYLSPLIKQGKERFFDYAKQPIQMSASLTRIQRQAKEQLALEDVQSLPGGQLRSRAQTLAKDLGKVSICLLDTLRSLSPGLRLHWAQLAEDDQIPLTPASRWPGMERATGDDNGAIRRVMTLVSWWLAQIDPESAGSPANSAMRDMIRALLIEAALGEADEIVRGRVSTIPPRFKAGERLRLVLNREARPGLNLLLIDSQQRIAGKVQLEDEDEQGATARITEVNIANTSLTTQFTVIQVSNTLKMR